jgi:hypothetical protein
LTFRRGLRFLIRPRTGLSSIFIRAIAHRFTARNYDFDTISAEPAGQQA